VRRHIELRDPADAVGIPRQSIADNECERRLPAVMGARRRALYEYRLFAVLAREIVKSSPAQRASGVASDRLCPARPES